MIKSFLKKYYPFIIPLAFLFLLHSYFIVTNKSYMIFYGDSFEENLMFLLGGWGKIHQLDFSLWDWTLGYGANIFSRTFYFLTSPFFLITSLFPKTWIPKLILFIYILKMYLVWIFVYLWLNEINKNKLASFIASTIFAFSGWILFFYHFYFFLDAFILYPIILLGIEKYIFKKNSLLLVISVAILAFINFYFMYMFLPFMGLYFWFRYLSTYAFNLKTYLFETLKFILFTLLGIGIASVVFIPSIVQIFATPRLDNVHFSLFDHVALKDIYRFVSTLYTPVMERFDPSYFISTDVYTGIGWGGGVSIHLGLLSLLLLPLYISSTSKKERNAFLFTLLLLLISAFFVVFYRLYQGSIDARWYYMFSFLFIFAVTRVLANLNEIQNLKKKLIFSFIFNIIVLFLLYFVSKSNQLNLSDLKESQLLYIVIYATFIFIIYFILLFGKSSLKIIIILVFFESAIAFYIPLLKNPPMEWMVLEEKLADLFDTNAVNYIQSIDKGFYRILKDNQSYLNQNEPFVQNYNGISFYTSIYNFETTDYYNRFNKTYSIPNTIGRDYSYLLTSVKYFVTDTNAHTAPYGFDYLTSVDDSDIYVNRYFLPLALVQDKSLNAEIFDQLSYLDQDRLLLDYAITLDSTNRDYYYRNDLLNYANEVHIDRYYVSSLDPIKDTMLIIENNESNSVNIRSSINSEFYRDDSYSQNFYTMKYLDKNSKVDSLEVFVQDANQLKNGYNIYLDTDLSWVEDWFNEKNNVISNINFSDQKISFDLIVNENNSYVVTSIPYNSNWHLKINNVETDFENVNGGFIGFELNKGNYKLLFNYQSDIFLVSIFASILSFVVFLILIRNSHIKKKNG